MRVFWALTVASAVTFCWVLWVFVQAYPFGFLHPFVPLTIHLPCQGILLVWCLRDMSKRSFPDSATTMNWLFAVLLTGVAGTTIYALNVMREQRPSR